MGLQMLAFTESPLCTGILYTFFQILTTLIYGVFCYVHFTHQEIKAQRNYGTYIPHHRVNECWD